MVSGTAYLQAKRQIENILKPYNERKELLDELQRKIENISTAMIAAEKEGRHHQPLSFIHGRITRWGCGL